MNGQQKKERPKQTLRRQVQESIKRIGLEVKEAANRTRWRWSQSDHRENEAHPAALGKEEHNGWKLDDDDEG